MKAEITFNTLVYAILALIVLVVIIVIFFNFTNSPFKNIFQTTQDTGNQTTSAWDNLANLFYKCSPSDQPRCVSGFLNRCNDGKWEKSNDAC